MMEEASYELKLKSYTLDELVDIRDHIDKKEHPERYALVLAEIEKRTKHPESQTEEPLAKSLDKSALQETPSQRSNQKSTPYAGFWRRFFAGFVDFLVLLPFLIFHSVFGQHSRTMALTLVIPMAFIYAAYNIYFHARWGQTIGKKATGIRVVKITGDPISWREAFFRNSVDICFSILYIIAMFIAFTSIGESEYSSLSWRAQSYKMVELYPAWHRWVGRVSQIWIWSEVIVLLFNEKKRALHDFIAGTVVVKNERLEEIRKSIHQ